jgi:hypothetical protein
MKTFNTECLYAESRLCRVTNKAIMLSVIMLGVIMLSVILLSVIMLSVVMLNVITPVRYQG